MAIFEGYERRIEKINAELKKYGINGIDDAKAICDAKGIDVFGIVRGIQPIAFENACWAYAIGAAIAIKTGATSADKAAVDRKKEIAFFTAPAAWRRTRCARAAPLPPPQRVWRRCPGSRARSGRSHPRPWR